MHPIASFIQRALLRKQAIVLPSVGILQIVRQPATFIDDGIRLTAPSDYILFEQTENSENISLVEALANHYHVTIYQAQESYRLWLEEVLDGEKLYIESVLTINMVDNTIALDNHFATCFNPLKNDRVVVQERVQSPLRALQPPRNSNPTTGAVIAIVLGCIAMAYLIYYVVTHTDLIR